MKAIYKRELRSYFNSMTGYIFIAVVIAFTGVYFMAVNLYGGYPYFSEALMSALSVFMFAIPVLTMRSLADERRSRTDQLLLTAPVSLTRIVLGKYLAMVTVLAIPVALFCLCPVIIMVNGTGYPVSDYASLFAFFLIGCVFIAIGMFISSLTESQIIASVCTFGVLFAIYLWPSLVNYLPTSAFGSLVGFLALIVIVCAVLWSMTHNALLTAGVGVIGAGTAFALYLFNSEALAGTFPAMLGVFSLRDTFTNFASYRMFDVGGLVLYLSFIFVFVFLTVQTLQKRRWS